MSLEFRTQWPTVVQDRNALRRGRRGKSVQELQNDLGSTRSRRFVGNH